MLVTPGFLVTEYEIGCRPRDLSINLISHPCVILKIHNQPIQNFQAHSRYKFSTRAKQVTISFMYNAYIAERMTHYLETLSYRSKGQLNYFVGYPISVRMRMAIEEARNH